jgi:putative heme-binding domain-containing protein
MTIKRPVWATAVCALAAGFFTEPGVAGSPAERHVVTAWPVGPLEVRVAFSAPLDRATATSLVGREIIFEETARRSSTEPRSAGAPVQGKLRIAAATLADAGQTLILATDPHPREGTYRLAFNTLDGQKHAIKYDLTGVEASWSPNKDEPKPQWTGWWPLIDPRLAKSLTAHSIEHEKGLSLISQPGILTLRTLVTLPSGNVTLRVQNNTPFEASLGGDSVDSADGPSKRHEAELKAESTGEASELVLTIVTGANRKPPEPCVTYQRDGDRAPIALDPKDLLVPWAPAAPPEVPATIPPNFDFKGGDAARGEVIFYSDEAKCSACHKIRGRGGEIGTDLTKLAESDPATIYRDIAAPSAVIDPSYVPFTVALKNGRVAVGVVRAEGADAVRVLDTNAKATVIPRTDIEELRPSGTSIMPVGLAGALGDAKIRDLLAFLRKKNSP